MATFSRRSSPRICRRCCLQILDVVADAAHAELTEVREVLSNLRRVEVKLLRQRLRRHGLHARRVERVEAPQVHGETVRGELGDLIAEVLSLDRQFHKDSIAVPGGTGTIEGVPSSPFVSLWPRSWCRAPRTSTLRRRPPPRRAASPAALLAYPGFYQAQLVVVRGTLVTRDRPVLLSTGIDRSIPLIFSGTPPVDGPIEARASFWDLGRLQRDDPRIATMGLDRLLPNGLEGEWPRPGEIIALNVTDAVAVKPSMARSPCGRSPWSRPASSANA